MSTSEETIAALQEAVRLSPENAPLRVHLADTLMSAGHAEDAEKHFREALKVKPRQQLDWSLGEDGTVIVRPQPSALDLFGSLKSPKKFPGRAAEREAAIRAVARHATKKGGE